MWTHPGKKLLFMGSEFAQGKEWNFDAELDWYQCDNDWHAGVKSLVKDLNRVYRDVPALHQKDCEKDGFSWLDHENAAQSVYSYIRLGNDGEKPAIVVCNFTPEVHHNFTLGAPTAGYYREVLNTDASIYGGSNQGNDGGIHSFEQAWQGQQHSIFDLLCHR